MDTTTIKFPINFNPIGLNYEMKYDNFYISNNVAYLHGRCQEAAQDTIECVVDHARKTQLKVGGILQLTNGTQYRIQQAIASGSYGITAVVQNSKDGRYYCLKHQFARDDNGKLGAYKEAIMHHILDLSTRPDGFRATQSNLIPRLYHVVRSNKVGGPIYFIMDLMYQSLADRLKTKPDHDRLRELMDCLVHITPTLKILYKRGIYNHGDLHTGNVMFDIRDGSYKLIDYGFSRIRIGGEGGHMLELDRRNARSDPSRDLTHLISTFEMYHREKKKVYREGSYEYAIEELIKTVAYEAECSGSVELGLKKHDPHKHNFINLFGKMPYDHFTLHTNEDGTHLKIQQAINKMRSLAERDAPSSELMPYAASAASAAPRTPRAGRAASAASSSSAAPRTPRAASAAVREEIVQINQHNPGCMLLLLLMMLLAMRGAVWLYHGKGGRVPVSYLSMSNQPVISSKHIPSQSFASPTHSIQMKSRSNNSYNKSNTRTNRTSKKNNTRRRSHKIPYAKIEDFDKLSLVSFYHFLRFEAFPGVSQNEKKEMLKEAVMVPLQRPDVFEQIVEAVKEKDMDYMMVILEENKLDLSKIGLEIEPYQELWNIILDAYFSEKDYPFDLLQTLLHVGGNVEDFLEQYRPANKEMKKMMVMQTCITASDCPDLMLE